MPEASRAGLDAFPSGFWDAYLDSPPIVSFTAAADLTRGGQSPG